MDADRIFSRPWRVAVSSPNFSGFCVCFNLHRVCKLAASVWQDYLKQGLETLSPQLPSLSRQLKDLEEELEKQLLIRGSKRLH